ncbi:MAG: hypothetical protein M3Z27_06405 [Actinomycetota bacterium]|nr:hypothetical protein [Actinomycetota bacterium]
MASNRVNKVVGVAARRLPGLRRLPALRLLALGEVALLAHDHLGRLTREERRRLLELVRTGRGRRRNLTLRERDELSELLAKVGPREFAAHAAQKLSPIPIPEPVVRRFARPSRH